MGAVRGGGTARRGGSRALPVAAITGLLFGVAVGTVVVVTGGQEAGAQSEAAAPSEVAARPAAEAAEAERRAAPEPAEPADSAASARPEPAGAATGDTEPAAAQPNAEPAAAQPAAEPVRATLRFAVEPRAVAGEVRITVDGEPVDDREHQLELTDGPREITVVARASGYRRFRTRLRVDGDETVAIELEKRRRRSGKKRDDDGDRGEPTGPGGLIDL